jgi:chaperone BCS1
LSLSIARDCNLDVYILSLSSIDDSSLDELFTKLPARCVILLEDIDAVDATQSRQQRAVGTRQDKTRSSIKGKPREELSLSALLNVLDSIGLQEGRILIMTTNHIERLDAVLIRAGRVDMKVELELANRDIHARLFSTMFLLDNAPDEGKGAEDKIPLEKLATEFTAMVPEQEFSPAEIQLFLLEHRRSPYMAVQNVQGWMARIREEKGQIVRAESEGFSGIPTSPPDILTTPDDIQAEEIESAVAATKQPTTPFTHCCSCQALQDIKSNSKLDTSWHWRSIFNSSR